MTSEIAPTSLPIATPPMQPAQGTTIYDLNYHVMEKLFTYFEPTERQVIRLVCKPWCEQINETYGITTYFNNTNTDLIYTTPWTKNTHFQSVTRPLEPDQISFSERVTEMEFKNMIVHYNFFPILQKCTHLRALSFTEPDFDLSESSMKALIPRNIELNEVQSLKFECWNFTEGFSTIIKLLDYIKFGRLTSITFQSVQPLLLPFGLIFKTVDNDDTNQGINPLIKLIRKNQETLKEFSFGTIICQNKLKFLVGTFEIGGIPQLEEVVLQNLYTTWTPILQFQFHLTTLIILNCNPPQWSTIRSCITQCDTMLVRIVIEGRTFGSPWDCDVFQTSTTLKELTLNIAMSVKRHLEMVPKHLTRLELDGPLSQVELSNIMGVTSLKQLQFNCLGANLFLLPEPSHTLVAEPNQVRSNPNVISLRTFLKFLRFLINLEVLIFKDCSQDSVAWTKINDWIKKTSEEPNKPVAVVNHYYTANGRRTQHGFTLKIQPHFDHGAIEIPGFTGSQVIHGMRRGFFGTIVDFFGGRRAH